MRLSAIDHVEGKIHDAKANLIESHEINRKLVKNDPLNVHWLIEKLKTRMALEALKFDPSDYEQLLPLFKNFHHELRELEKQFPENYVIITSLKEARIQIDQIEGLIAEVK
ncbi:hypothetical protein C8024_00595 [Sphingopyxis sp. BSNA05]|nr:hypothetical protein [Sphingopyxis sp. BSNA05]